MDSIERQLYLVPTVTGRIALLVAFSVMFGVPFVAFAYVFTHASLWTVGLLTGGGTVTGTMVMAARTVRSFRQAQAGGPPDAGSTGSDTTGATAA